MQIAITQVIAKKRGLGQTQHMELLIDSLKAGTHLDDAQIAEAAAQLAFDRAAELFTARLELGGLAPGEATQVRG